MDPYLSSSDDEAPEAVGLSTAKAASQQRIKAQRDVEKKIQEAKREKNRARDKALKEQKAKASGSAKGKLAPAAAPASDDGSDAEEAQEEDAASGASDDEDEEQEAGSDDEDEDALPASLVQALAEREDEESDEDSDDEDASTNPLKRKANLTTFDSDDDEFDYSGLAGELADMYGDDDEDMSSDEVMATRDEVVKVVALDQKRAPPAPSATAMAFAQRALSSKKRRVPVSTNLSHGLTGRPAFDFTRRTGSANRSGKPLTAKAAKNKKQRMF
ncbi:hypothetical protein H9P43_003539 [Blastocladiella emersonii ATCC 22665]|nr:hypothetical protein H9P43_003539 [Blastocladiella emersonii ATCC 22665]